MFLAVVLLVLAALLTVIGMVSVAWVRARPRRHSAVLPNVSVLKPLSGADPGLADNLRSFFEQDHPGFELIFGVAQPTDQAVPVVRALMAEFPDVSAQLIIHGGGFATNPKVSNLRGMIGCASHDLVVISDSNIRAPQDYLRDLASTWLEDPEGTGVVTSLFAGTEARSLGARLECVQLNGFVAAGAAVPVMLGDPVVIGKSMLFSRRVFERLGGFASVSDVLAEDYMIGKMFQHAGYEVRIGRVIIENVTGDASVSRFFDRHQRWSILRTRLHPVAFALEPLLSPLVLLPLALAVLGPYGWLYSLGLIVVRDVVQWIFLRGLGGAYWALLLAPVREAIMLAAWATAPFTKYVAWRGHRVRIGAGTRVFIPDPGSGADLDRDSEDTLRWSLG